MAYDLCDRYCCCESHLKQNKQIEFTAIVINKTEVRQRQSVTDNSSLHAVCVCVYVCVYLCVCVFFRNILKDTRLIALLFPSGRLNPQQQQQQQLVEVSASNLSHEGAGGGAETAANYALK